MKAKRLFFQKSTNRQNGIALMVVMILFVILILVVFQLQYTTKLEEELAEIRATNSLGTFATASAAAHIMTLLAEDFRDSYVQNAGAPGERSGISEHQKNVLRTEGLVGGMSSTELGEVGGLGNLADSRGVAEIDTSQSDKAKDNSGTYDYILKRIFKSDTKTINGVTVRFKISDNERRVDLNQIWDYPRPIAATISGSQEEIERDELVKEVEKAEEEKDDPTKEIDPDSVDPTALLDEVADQENQLLNMDFKIFVPPTETMREMTREMLIRIIDMTVQLNEERGFLYRFQIPSSATIAYAIEEYCFMKRIDELHNTIDLVSEILNIEGFPPELFYGPSPEIPKGDIMFDPTEIYTYSYDEYGDLVGEALYINQDWLLEQEFRSDMLDDFMQQSGPLSHIPQMGGHLSSPMTRSMEDYPDDIEGFGKLVPPLPIGLKDLFCTKSSGRININTVAPPILYGLLLSLDEEDAYHVALDIEEYRHLYQEEMTDDEMESRETGANQAVTDQTRNLGQPMREPQRYDDYEFGAYGDDAFLAGGNSMSSMENPDTNYFTGLQQLVLIDGEEGDNDDILRLDEGVERISEDYKTPYQNARHDLQQIVTYGSIYFSVNIKVKSENSPTVKEGNLLLHRDLQKRRIEILQWKEMER